MAADPSTSNPFDSVDMDDPIDPNCEDSITLGEVFVTMFDWVAAHKSTKTATEDVWAMLRAVCPPGQSPGTYAIAERIMRHHLLDSVVCIPVWEKQTYRHAKGWDRKDAHCRS